MPRKYSTNKTDGNQKDIVKHLLEIPGISVKTNVDDILVGYNKVNYWFEIKRPDRSNKKGELYNRNRKTEKNQIDLLETWRGQYAIVSTLEQILEAIGI